MSVTIDNELMTFYDKISPVIGTLPSFLTSLSSKLQELNTSTKTAVTDFSGCYSGEGLSTAVGAFNSVNAAVEGIAGSFAEGPERAISQSSELIAKIEELKTMKEEIDALELDLSKVGARWPVEGDENKKNAANLHNSKIDSLESQIAAKENTFKTYETNAKTKLAEVKSIDAEIDITVPEQVATVDGELLVDIQNLTPGTYSEYVYTGKNGKTIKTYIYVPANASTTTGLPVHLYMGGTGETGKANAGGLAKLLNEGKQASGIVIVLESQTYRDYDNGDYIDTAIELTNNVVTTYKADANRISVSGHSLGGIGALCFAERYPDYFSVCAPVSGYNNHRGANSSSAQEAYDKLKRVKIVAVSGRSDTDSYNSMVGLTNKLADGGNAQFIPVSGGHRIQFQMYDNPVEVNGQTYSNWLEFCLAQTKENTTITS